MFGYELLFRNGVANVFNASDLDAASRSTLDSSLLMELDVLCDGRRAFMNCTRDTLVRGLVRLLPSQSTVVEVLENVPADAEVVQACQRLKEAGYLIALDDYVADDNREPLAEIADIIKVELKLTTPAERLELIKRYGPWRCACWPRKSRPTPSLWRRASKASFISRDTSSAGRKCWPHTTCPPTDCIICACWRRSRIRNSMS